MFRLVVQRRRCIGYSSTLPFCLFGTDNASLFMILYKGITAVNTEIVHCKHTNCSKCIFKFIVWNSGSKTVLPVLTAELKSDVRSRDLSVYIYGNNIFTSLLRRDSVHVSVPYYCGRKNNFDSIQRSWYFIHIN